MYLSFGEVLMKGTLCLPVRYVYSSPHIYCYQTLSVLVSSTYAVIASCEVWAPFITPYTLTLRIITLFLLFNTLLLLLISCFTKPLLHMTYM